MHFPPSFSQAVGFKASSGVLELAHAQGYAGAIYGFSKTGGTSLDLRDIAFGGSTKASYNGTATSGVLTVTDGTHTANIHLIGDYLGSTFTASSDGKGGTTIIDPPKGVATPTTSPFTTAPSSPHIFIAAMASLGGSHAGTVGGAVETRHALPAMLSAARHAMLT